MGENPFPSMKAQKLLAVLSREPLVYRCERQQGSHRRMVSDKGYPALVFAFHDRQTISRGLVRKILTKDVGLPVEKALELL